MSANGPGPYPSTAWTFSSIEFGPDATLQITGGVNFGASNFAPDAGTVDIAPSLSSTDGWGGYLVIGVDMLLQGDASMTLGSWGHMKTGGVTARHSSKFSCAGWVSATSSYTFQTGSRMQVLESTLRSAATAPHVHGPVLPHPADCIVDTLIRIEEGATLSMVDATLYLQDGAGVALTGSLIGQGEIRGGTVTTAGAPSAAIAFPPTVYVEDLVVDMATLVPLQVSTDWEVETRCRLAM